MSYVDDIPRHSAGDKCPGCNAYDKPKGGILRAIKSKIDGKYFLGCNRYPDCKYTVSSFYTEKYKDEKYKKERARKYPQKNQFKKNVPKKLRKEWGERMSFFKSL